MSDTTRYAEAALAKACDAVSNAPRSNGNNTLNTEAFSIGQLVGAGVILRSTAESMLLSAAQARNIDGARETIRSGLNAGAAKPRDLTSVSPNGPPKPRPSPTHGDEKKRSTAKYAMELYCRSGSIEGTLAERYLREHRGLSGTVLPRGARYHPGIKHKGSGTMLPALVVPISSIDKAQSTANSVHVTFLDPRDGTKFRGQPAKQMFGAVNGGAVWIGDYAEHMLCCEGIEKGMACQAATGMSVAVGLSATIMPHIVWPRGTAKITICADPNAAGEIGLNKAAAAWTAQGKEVFVCYPPQQGKDWDEADEGRVHAVISNAIPWQPTTVKRKSIFEAADASDFERDAQGQILKNEWNILHAISSSGVTLAYNEFAMDYHVGNLEGYGPYLDNDAQDELYLLLQREYSFKPAWDDFRRVIRSAARRESYHPVRDYLSSLEWDGTDRIDEWLIGYAGAKDTAYHRAIGRIVLIAAVRRVRRPGAKFDEVVVLESREGMGKSTALRILAGDKWFSDSAPFNAEPRETIEQLRGRWIIECADLAGVRKAEVEHVKAFLSRSVDTARLAYERETTRFPRQCVFIGSTNDQHYLPSTTGNRRFWPVPITCFDLEALARDRDQLWAEAAYWEAQNESIRLPKELWADAAVQQKEREEIDSWDDVIADWLATQSRDSCNLLNRNYRTRIIDVARGALGVEVSKLEARTEKRISKCLKRAGWEPTRSHGQRLWKPID